MANTKNNKYFKETEERIIKKALVLMEQKPFHKITVRSICQLAEVNPSTFYAHFIDIYDMLDKIELHLKKDFENEFALKMSLKDGVLPFSKESLLIFVSYIRANASFYRVLFQNNTDFSCRLFGTYNTKLEAAHLQTTNLTQTEFAYLLLGFHGSIYMVLKNWLNHNCEDADSVIVSVIMDCIPLRLRQAMIPLFC